MVQDLPEVSVLIPCYQEADSIENCLKSILAQVPIQGGFEVLVIDGLSSDGTKNIIQKIAQIDSRIKLVENQKRFQSVGLNIGILLARGKIIIRMDAHTEYAPDYISECVRVLKETGADNVGGPARTKSKSYLQRAIAAAYHSAFSVGGARFHNVSYEGYVDTVTYGCWYKKTLLKLGLFDEEMIVNEDDELNLRLSKYTEVFDEELIRNQDDELNLRIEKSGGKIWQSPSIKSWYYPRNSLRNLFNQYFQYGYWKVLVIKKHQLPASWRHLVPGTFVVGLLGVIIMLPFNNWAPWFLSSMVAAYGSAIILASLFTAAQAGWSLLPVLPLIFPCYHFGYGLGFLKGTLDFVILRRQTSRNNYAITR
jgi:succinoglycan biosynthesis protein ExoA